jgi:hypothetical protein
VLPLHWKRRLVKTLAGAGRPVRIIRYWSDERHPLLTLAVDQHVRVRCSPCRPNARWGGDRLCARSGERPGAGCQPAWWRPAWSRQGRSEAAVFRHTFPSEGPCSPATPHSVCCWSGPRGHTVRRSVRRAGGSPRARLLALRARSTARPKPVGAVARRALRATRTVPFPARAQPAALAPRLRSRGPRPSGPGRFWAGGHSRPARQSVPTPTPTPAPAPRPGAIPGRPRPTRSASPAASRRPVPDD